MKLHLQTVGTQFAFTGYGAGFVAVNRERYAQSLIVTADQVWTDWGATTFDALTAEHFERLAALDQEIVLLGSGTRFRFPSPALINIVRSKGLGFEVMDTQAACRTYNILLAEDRKVAAAVLVDQ
ncbi:MAG: Mth938-like domain-containing protein [Burkholderiales bacterium]